MVDGFTKHVACMSCKIEVQLGLVRDSCQSHGSWSSCSDDVKVFTLELSSQDYGGIHD